VTVVPTTPVDGERLASVGVTATVNGLVLLAIPETVTTTLPVVAPFGTGTDMLIGLHAVAADVVPANEIVLVP